MKFTYSGPMQAITLPDGTETVLVPGGVIDLPAGPFAEDLAGLGRLAPVEEPTVTAAPETAVKPKKGGD